MSDDDEMVIDMVGRFLRVAADVFIDPEEVALVFRNRSQDQTVLVLKSGHSLSLGRGQAGPKAEQVRRLIAEAEGR